MDRVAQVECPAGHFCSSGVMEDCGSVAVWCDVRSSSPTPVQGGWYSLPVGVNETRRVGVSECEPGEYCFGSWWLLVCHVEWHGLLQVTWPHACLFVDDVQVTTALAV